MSRIIKIILSVLVTMLLTISFMFIYNNTFTTSIIFVILAFILVVLLSDILY